MQPNQMDLLSFLNVYHFKTEHIFTNNRLKLWSKGLCISSLQDKTLITAYCDPNLDQTFSMSADGKLISNKSGNCLSKENFNSPLTFDNCSGALSFAIVNNSYLRSTDGDRSEVKCVTPVFNKVGKKVTPKISQIGVEFKLMKCNKITSRIDFVEELIFQIDRKALKSPAKQLDSASCNYAWCHLNQRNSPVKSISDKRIVRCTHYADCVTVVTKTARRPLLVLRMAQSIRDIKGYDLPIIAFDDGPEDYDEEIHQKFDQFPLLEYNIGDNDDLGISVGRNLAVSMVKTKYTLFVDDDNIFTNKTTLELAVEILESTDASVVGGKYSHYNEFSGFLEFGVYGIGEEKFAQLKLYKGSCTEGNKTIPNFPSCLNCDLTSNIFLAKTMDIQEVGGWSPELKTMEHKDIFLKFKAAGKKVVYCPDFEVINRKATPGTKFSPQNYPDKRVRRSSKMNILFCYRWNIHKVQENPRDHFNFSELFSEDL